jgi:hypothetical protein
LPAQHYAGAQCILVFTKTPVIPKASSKMACLTYFFVLQKQLHMLNMRQLMRLKDEKNHALNC